MKKALLIGGSIFALVVFAAALLVYQNNKQFDTGDIYLKQAKALKPDTKPCAKSNDSLKISTQERSDIEMGAILHILDVPAGTNVDVRISSVSNGKAGGAAIYPGDYGTYNFELTNSDGGRPGSAWKVTSFKPCKA